MKGSTSIYWPGSGIPSLGVNFDPSVGGEIRRKRSAVIVSNDASNKYLNRVQVVPLTSKADRLYPSEALVLLNGKKSKRYLTNKAVDDVHFIERFTILNVPISIKFMVILLPAFLLLAFFFFSVSWSGVEEIETEIMSYSMRIMVPIGMIVY